MNYRAYQLRPRSLMTDLAQVAMQVATREIPPEEIRTGVQTKEALDLLSANFPTVPIIIDGRTGMRDQCWFGYTGTPPVKELADDPEDRRVSPPRPRRSRANKKPAAVD